MAYGFTDEQLKSTKEILEECSEIESAIIFGSRAMNTFKVASDVDIALKGKISLSTISALKSALEESTLPYLFDILDYKTIKEPKLKEHIVRYGKVFYVRGWEGVMLGDVCDITSSKRIFHSEYQKEGIPFYRSKEIIEKQKGNDVSTELFISEDKFYEIKNKFGYPKYGDLLLTSVGTLGTPYLIKKNEKFYFKDGNLTWFKSFQGLDQKYFYYWILSDLGKESLQSITIGSTQSALTIVGLKSISLNIPPLSEQKTIAEVLSSFDDKIELLRKQNKILESTTGMLFKEWFVDFNFPNVKGKPYKLSGGKMIDSEFGEIPDKWKVFKLQDIVDTVSGYSYKGEELVEKSSKALVTLKSFDRKGGFQIRGFKPFAGFPAASQEVTIKDLVVAHTDLTQDAEVLGNPAFIFDNSGYKKMYITMDLVKVISKSYKVNISALYYLMKTRKFKHHCVGYANGTTVLHLSKKAIPEYEVVLPKDLNLLNEFSLIASAVTDKISNNVVQIQALGRLRDMLLPKLMRGEVRVKL